jgi:hypothetical protein
MIARLFVSARKLDVTLPQVRFRLRQWLELQPPDHFLLIEPDQELRRILAAEIARAVTSVSSLAALRTARGHSKAGCRFSCQIAKQGLVS